MLEKVESWEFSQRFATRRCDGSSGGKKSLCGAGAETEEKVQWGLLKVHPCISFRFVGSRHV